MFIGVLVIIFFANLVKACEVHQKIQYTQSIDAGMLVNNGNVFINNTEYMSNPPPKLVSIQNPLFHEQAYLTDHKDGGYTFVVFDSNAVHVQFEDGGRYR